MGQRTCSFEGEYAPETYAVVTDLEYAESPEYLDDKLKEWRKVEGANFDAMGFVDVSVSMADVLRVLMPTAKPIKGSIKL